MTAGIVRVYVLHNGYDVLHNGYDVPHTALRTSRNRASLFSDDVQPCNGCKIDAIFAARLYGCYPKWPVVSNRNDGKGCHA